jgi:hypothetical protein
VETFGAPIIDQEANRELFEEQAEVVFKAFNNESFSHKGNTTRYLLMSPIAAISSRS